MKFTVNTKPLQDTLDLIVVPGNISRFFQKSTILQISIDGKDSLKLNSEAASVVSEAKLKGSIENLKDGIVRFVDSMLFKQLIDTLDSSTVSLEFEDNHIVVVSGKSKFNIPNLQIDEDARLSSPAQPSGKECELNVDIWSVVRDKQLYAISDSFIKLVYKYIYNGNGKILVGDYINSLFTLTEKPGLPTDCLLSSNIISVILGIDPKSKIYQVDKSYVVSFATDAFKFTAELKPRYEDDPELGNYSADIIGGLFDTVGSSGIKIPSAKLRLLLNQTNLIVSSLSTNATASKDTAAINWTCSGNKLKILSDNIDSEFEGELIGTAADWTIDFKLKLISQVISNLEGDTIQIYPTFQEEVANALVFKDDKVSVILAGIEK
jgi:hypothetical protein